MPFHGQPAALFVDGDPMQVAVGDPATDGELILVFTNAAAAANTLRSTLPLSMRVLIVGGGGAGGYGTTGSSKPGGGGGGGEVIELGNKGRGRGNSAPFQFSRNSLTEDEISDIPKRKEKQMNLLRVIILVLWLIFHRPTR